MCNSFLDLDGNSFLFPFTGDMQLFVDITSFVRFDESEGVVTQVDDENQIISRQRLKNYVKKFSNSLTVCSI